MAWSYDLVSAVVSLGRWRSWVFCTLPYLPGPQVLELGFGPGHLLQALADRGVAAVGLDASYWMARKVLAWRSDKKFIPSAVNGYAQFMPFSSGVFDQVVATFPTEYAWDEDTLREIYRVLRPGGALVLLPIAWITGNRLPDRIARKIFQITGQAPALDDTSPGLQLQALLETRGFLVKITHLELESSRVLLVLGQKPD